MTADALGRLSKSVSDAQAMAVDKRILFKLGEVTVCDVNGKAVRDTYHGFPDPDDPMEFVLAGHHYRYAWIPEPEIWLVRESQPEEKLTVLLFHEFPERYVMKKYGMEYEAAHNLIADACEHAARLTIPADLVAALAQLVK